MVNSPVQQTEVFHLYVHGLCRELQEVSEPSTPHLYGCATILDLQGADGCSKTAAVLLKKQTSSHCCVFDHHDVALFNISLKHAHLFIPRSMSMGGGRPDLSLVFASSINFCIFVERGWHKSLHRSSTDSQAVGKDLIDCQSSCTTHKLSSYGIYPPQLAVFYNLSRVK